MKRLASIASLTAALCCFAPLVSAVKFDEQVAFENKFKEQLEGRIAQIIPQTSFRVVVSAAVSEDVIKRELEGEDSASKRANTAPKKVQEQALPGFIPPPKAAKAESDSGEESRRRKFNFEKQTTIRSVGVILMLDDQAIAQDKRTVVTEFVRQYLTRSFGTAATLKVVDTGLEKKPLGSYEAMIAWAKSYAKQHGFTIVDWLIYAAIALFFAAAMLILVHTLRGRRKQPVEPSTSQALAPISPRESLEDDDADTASTKLVDTFLSDPLLVRTFLLQLEASDKAAVLRAFRTQAMRTYLAEVMQFEAVGTLSEDVSTGSLSAIQSDLAKYMKLERQRLSLPFGFLRFLPEDDLREFLKNEPDTIGAAASISRYLSDRQLAAVLNMLPIDDKLLFYDKIDDGARLGEAAQALEGRLRQLFKECEGALFAGHRVSRVRELFFEMDGDASALVQKMQEQKRALPAGADKFRVKFSDLRHLPKDVLERLLDALPNATIAAAWTRELAKDGEVFFQDLLSEMRLRMVLGMRRTARHVTDQDIETAQREALKTYRSLA